MNILAQICLEAFDSEEDPDVIQEKNKTAGKILATKVVYSITRGLISREMEKEFSRKVDIWDA